jgi:hypothetical protein
MAEFAANQATVLIPRHSIPKPVRDSREPYQKQLASYLILASVLFERMAFYSLASNLVLYLESDKLHWHPKYGVTALNIFYGK